MLLRHYLRYAAIIFAITCHFLRFRYPSLIAITLSLRHFLLIAHLMPPAYYAITPTIASAAAA